MIVDFVMDDEDLLDDTPISEKADEAENEAEIHRRREKRFAELGFYPQKEKIFNAFLPYGDKLDAESQALWQEIKANLGKSIALRELRPGYVMWRGRMLK